MSILLRTVTYVCRSQEAGWLIVNFRREVTVRLLCTVLVQSVISLLTLVTARLHIGVFMLLRVLSGFSAGFELTAIHALVGRWLASRNRSVVVTVLFTSMNAGVVVGVMLSGFLCDYGFIRLLHVRYGGLFLVGRIISFRLRLSLDTPINIES